MEQEGVEGCHAFNASEKPFNLRLLSIENFKLIDESATSLPDWGNTYISITVWKNINVISLTVRANTPCTSYACIV